MDQKYRVHPWETLCQHIVFPSLLNLSSPDKYLSTFSLTAGLCGVQFVGGGTWTSYKENVPFSYWIFSVALRVACKIAFLGHD
jgi:hypothetical protein